MILLHTSDWHIGMPVGNSSYREDQLFFVDELIRVGSITIDSENYEAYRNNEKLQLTLKEYELLKLLAETPGRVLTRDFLLDRIWGYEFYGETRTVDVHIRHIRMKLGDDAGMIETVRGVGYRMTASA